MKKDCIGDFISAWKQYDSSKVSDPSFLPEHWNRRFDGAGYYRIEGKQLLFAEWFKVHQWCKETFGERHYAWTGTTFWFETEQDAMWFALRWS